MQDNYRNLAFDALDFQGVLFAISEPQEKEAASGERDAATWNELPGEDRGGRVRYRFMSSWYMLAVPAKLLAIIGGALCLYTVFLYEDEQGAIQSKIEDLWLQIEDTRARNVARHTTFLREVARVTVRGFDKAFGQGSSITHGDLQKYKARGLMAPVVVGRNTEDRRDGKPKERERSITTVQRELSFMSRILDVAVSHVRLMRHPFESGEPLLMPGDEKPRERIFRIGLNQRCNSLTTF